MSTNRWDEIEFDKLPSKAGLIYRNAFAERDITAARYKAFIEDRNSKINTAALYPYDLVHQAVNMLQYDYRTGNSAIKGSEIDRKALDKAWSQLKDFLNNSTERLMSIVDTSGSMTTGAAVRPIDVAISLGIYTAERMGGAFKDFLITFASRPQFLKVEGVDFVDKVRRIYDTNLVDSTNLTAVFDLLYNLATAKDAVLEDFPTKLVVISDMEIDSGSHWRSDFVRRTEMEQMRKKWKAAGLKMPDLIYWNVSARNNVILEDAEEEGVSFVSGCSPSIFETILSGKTGWDLCYSKLMSERYEPVK